MKILLPPKKYITTDIMASDGNFIFVIICFRKALGLLWYDIIYYCSQVEKHSLRVLKSYRVPGNRMCNNYLPSWWKTSLVGYRLYPTLAEISSVQPKDCSCGTSLICKLSLNQVWLWGSWCSNNGKFFSRMSHAIFKQTRGISQTPRTRPGAMLDL